MGGTYGFTVDSPAVGANYCVGCVSEGSAFDVTGPWCCGAPGTYERSGHRDPIDSLYEAQLADRHSLGEWGVGFAAVEGTSAATRLVLAGNATTAGEEDEEMADEVAERRSGATAPQQATVSAMKRRAMLFISEQRVNVTKGSGLEDEDDDNEDDNGPNITVFSGTIGREGDEADAPATAAAAAAPHSRRDRLLRLERRPGLASAIQPQSLLAPELGHIHARR